MLKFPTPNKSLAVVMGSAVEAALKLTQRIAESMCCSMSVGVMAHGTINGCTTFSDSSLTPCATFRDRRRSGTT